jgi:two-component sensor histidine kinase
MQKNQLELALAAGRLGTWQYDFNTELVSGDDTFWANFGLQPGPPRKAREVIRSIHRNDRQMLRHALARCSTPNAPGFDIDLRTVWPDGTTHWINLRGRPDQSGESAFRLLGACAEVTERREAEIARARAAHQTTTIQVLSHRIGNLFPVIVSLVRMGAQHYGDVASFQQALLKRLRALEGTHILLARELDEAALIEDLVRVELAAFEDEGQVAINGARVHLAGGAAESFSMIVHELATNSAKYGALSVRPGKVNVRWRREEASQSLVFEWVESNGPPTKPSGRQGYGSAIIGATGAPLVGDSARVDFKPEGLHYTLTIQSTNSTPRRKRTH